MKMTTSHRSQQTHTSLTLNVKTNKPSTTTYQAEDSGYDTDNIQYPSELTGGLSVNRLLKLYNVKVVNNHVTGRERNINKAIIGAFKTQNRQCLQILLQDPKIVNRHLNLEGHTNSTLLHMAARFTDQSTTQTLLNRGLDINAKSTDGFTPLHLAAGQNNPTYITYLINHGANVNAIAHFTASPSKLGVTPLHIAVHHSYITTTKLLLEAGADVNARNNESWTCLHYAARYACVDTIRLLLSYGAEVNWTNNAGRSALTEAVASGDLETVRLLLEAGADVDVKGVDGCTPLLIAERKGQNDIVEVLRWHAAACGGERKEQKVERHHHLNVFGKH